MWAQRCEIWRHPQNIFFSLSLSHGSAFLSVWEYFSFLFLPCLCLLRVYSLLDSVLSFSQQILWVYTNTGLLTQVSTIIKAYWSENKWHRSCLFFSEFCCSTNKVMCPHSVCVCVCVCVCLFQHALRLLAFGQLYKVLNMHPLPASKPLPRLLEGVCSAVCVCVCVCVCVFSQESVWESVWVWRFVCQLLSLHVFMQWISVWISLSVRQLVQLLC